MFSQLIQNLFDILNKACCGKSQKMIQTLLFKRLFIISRYLSADVGQFACFVRITSSKHNHFTHMRNPFFNKSLQRFANFYRFWKTSFRVIFSLKQFLISFQQVSQKKFSFRHKIALLKISSLHCISQNLFVLAVHKGDLHELRPFYAPYAMCCILQFSFLQTGHRTALFGVRRQTYKLFFLPILFLYILDEVCSLERNVIAVCKPSFKNRSDLIDMYG